MLKKVLVGALIVGMLAIPLALTGCGGGNSAQSDSIAGSWELTGMEVDGEEMPEEYLKQYLDAAGDDNLVLEFTEDGKVSLSFVGESTEDATYSYEGGKGNIEVDGESLDFTVEDGAMKMESEGTVLVFSKK